MLNPEFTFFLSSMSYFSEKCCVCVCFFFLNYFNYYFYQNGKAWPGLALLITWMLQGIEVRSREFHFFLLLFPTNISAIPKLRRNKERELILHGPLKKQLWSFLNRWEETSVPLFSSVTSISSCENPTHRTCGIVERFSINPRKARA